MKNNVYSVGQVNAYIKNMFAQDFMMSHIYVRGEVSNCKYHTSGHIYFTLKDKSGTLSAIMFSGKRRTGLPFRMKEGDNVIVLGAVRIYERDGKYQLYADSIMLEGAGILYQRFEALKKELEEMGMFAQEYKQPIPAYAQTVGVVTAPTGAAVRDIQNIAARRNPYVQLVLYPALVQGEGAAASIVQGIRALEAYGVDVMIVGRGGGSIEDLWAFNEEIVARAIFECRVPVISAVGHETDTTIADYAADLRAPTPSAAAELAVFDIRAVTDRMRQTELMLNRAVQGKLTQAENRIDSYLIRLKLNSPQSRLEQKRQQSMEYEERMQRAMEHMLTACRHRLEILAASLDGLSPLKKISSGFAYVSDEAGKPVRSVQDTAEGDLLRLCLQDGEMHTEVKEKIYRRSADGM